MGALLRGFIFGPLPVVQHMAPPWLCRGYSLVLDDFIMSSRQNLATRDLIKQRGDNMVGRVRKPQRIPPALRGRTHRSAPTKNKNK
jgi:hypothetical protein